MISNTCVCYATYRSDTIAQCLLNKHSIRQSMHRQFDNVQQNQNCYPMQIFSFVSNLMKNRSFRLIIERTEFIEFEQDSVDKF